MSDLTTRGSGGPGARGFLPAEPGTIASSLPRESVSYGPHHPLLEGKTGAGISIGVIDSGVHLQHPHVGGVASLSGIDGEGNAADDGVDRLGHGTAVVSAIHEKAPSAAIRVVKVFDRTLSTTTTALVRALDQCSEEGMTLVNLSLGTENAAAEPRLKEAVRRCGSRGTIVVSARGDGDRLWYPGAIRGAIGVQADWGCPRDSMCVELFRGSARFFASGFARPIPGVPPEYNIRGVSFAVANVTGLLACVLEGKEELQSPRALAELFRKGPVI